MLPRTASLHDADQLPQARSRRRHRMPQGADLLRLLHVKGLPRLVGLERRALEVHPVLRRPDRGRVGGRPPPDALAEPRCMRLEPEQAGGGDIGRGLGRANPSPFRTMPTISASAVSSSTTSTRPFMGTSSHSPWGYDVSPSTTRSAAPGDWHRVAPQRTYWHGATPCQRWIGVTPPTTAPAARVAAAWRGEARRARGRGSAPPQRVSRSSRNDPSRR